MASESQAPDQKGAANNNDSSHPWPSVTRFCRQYLQLEPDLDYPDGTILREDDVQTELYMNLFADDALPRPPPPRYQLRVLKTLLPRIEGAIEDWDLHVWSLSPTLNTHQKFH
jgi:hypothetical protein